MGYAEHFRLASGKLTCRLCAATILPDVEDAVKLDRLNIIAEGHFRECEKRPKQWHLKIRREYEPESPREWDNLGLFAGWHRRYKIGDVQPKEDPQDWLKANAPKGSVVLPVFMIDHSGLSFSTGSFADPWDSGQVGWIVATPARIREHWGVKKISKQVREQVEKALKAEIETYDQWSQGNVWGYVYQDLDDPSNGDSCWGYYDKEHLRGDLPEEIRPLFDEAWENRH